MSKRIENELIKYLKERKWDKQHPADITKSIIIEASELLVNWQWNHDTANKIKKNGKSFENVKDELGDVLIYAIELAICFGLDYEEVILNKLEKVKKKYPATVVKKNKKKIL
jgi:NTP pyrophosphatase (non-canonical NTP hydrolase)